MNPARKLENEKAPFDDSLDQFKFSTTSPFSPHPRGTGNYDSRSEKGRYSRDSAASQRRLALCIQFLLPHITAETTIERSRIAWAPSAHIDVYIADALTTTPPQKRTYNVRPERWHPGAPPVGVVFA